MKLLAFVFVLTSLLFISSQTLPPGNSEYTDTVDQFVSRVDANKTYSEEIAEGSLFYGSETGSFKTYSFYDKETNQLYRIRHNEFTVVNLYQKFYYLDEELIYASVDKGRWVDSTYHDEFKQVTYFEDGKMVHTSNDKMVVDELYETGMNHLKAHRKKYK